MEDTKPDSSVEEETTESADSCQHEYGRWYTTKAPTETEEGVKERFCQKCGKRDKQSIPTLGEIRDESDSCQHEYGRWYTTKEPTETEEGVKERFCEKCGKLDKQSIPPLGEIRDEIVNDPIGGSPSTEGTLLIVGCTGSIGTSIGGVMLALAVCAVVRKKRK